MEHLIKPHGGELRDLLVDSERAEALAADSGGFPSVTLNLRQICDLELLLNGGFSPLRGFMNLDTYESVIDDWCLPDGTLWSLPIILDVPGKQAELLEPGQQLLCQLVVDHA